MGLVEMWEENMGMPLRTTKVTYSPETGRIHVALGTGELVEALGVALRRLAESQHLEGRAGCQKNFTDEYNGAIGEIVFTRVVGSLVPLGVNTFKQPDAEGIQVRTRATWDGRLVYRPGDPEDDVYVLVVGAGCTWEVVGGILGTSAKKVGSWYDENGRPGCWMVDQSRLLRLDKSKKFGHMFRKDEIDNETPVRACHE